MRALIPNAITVLALCIGLTGVRFAIAGDWERALAAILVAGVLDGVDGRVARLLKGTSRFGAELDSLSDVIAFGVAPALVVYLWSLQAAPGVGWIFALAHAVCCALRLARFNAALDLDDQPHKRLGFLTGVPSPAGAGLTLAPMFLSLWLGLEFSRAPWFVGPWVGLTAFLMISNLPTFSWTAARVRPHWRLPALLLIGLLAGALASEPWMTLSLAAIAYAISVPFGIRAYRRRSAPEAHRERTATASPAGDGRADAGPDGDAPARMADGEGDRAAEAPDRAGPAILRDEGRHPLARLN